MARSQPSTGTVRWVVLAHGFKGRRLQNIQTRPEATRWWSLEQRRSVYCHVRDVYPTGIQQNHDTRAL